MRRLTEATGTVVITGGQRAYEGFFIPLTLQGKQLLTLKLPSASLHHNRPFKPC